MKSTKNAVIKQSIIPEIVSASFTYTVTTQQELKPLKKFQGLSNFITAHGFTLIELLVVVLIIGILAAVAVPQYQVSVAKAKLTQALVFASTVRKAQDMYFLANNTYTRNFEEFDIEFPGNTNEDKNYISTDNYGIWLSSNGIVNSSIRNPTIEIFLWPNSGRKDCRAYKTDSPLSDKVCKAVGGIYQAWDQNDTYTLYYLP